MVGVWQDTELRSIFEAVGVVAESPSGPVAFGNSTKDGRVSMEDLFEWMEDDKSVLAARVKALGVDSEVFQSQDARSTHRSHNLR